MKTATRGAAGVAAMVAGSKLGATLGASLIPAVGPFVVVSIRQITAALVLLPFGRWRYRPALRDFVPMVVLGLVVALIKNAVYVGIGRIGVGLTITLEYVGPLAVMLLARRRLLDAACGFAAVTGVALLIAAPVALDLIGVIAALVGAACWAAYILLNQRMTTEPLGNAGPGGAALVAASFATWALIVNAQALDARIVVVGAAAGALSSALPLVLDGMALSRIDGGLSGLLASLNPAFAAVIAWLVVGQVLAPRQWLGIVMITLASALALTLARRSGSMPSSSHPESDAPTVE